jgi:hypothetical protein
LNFGGQLMLYLFIPNSASGCAINREAQFQPRSRRGMSSARFGTRRPASGRLCRFPDTAAFVYEFYDRIEPTFAGRTAPLSQPSCRKHTHCAGRIGESTEPPRGRPVRRRRSATERSARPSRRAPPRNGSPGSTVGRPHGSLRPPRSTYPGPLGIQCRIFAPLPRQSCWNAPSPHCWFTEFHYCPAL